MASITRRGAVWQVRVRRKGAPLVVRTFDLRADADAWASEIEREFRRGNIAALRQDAQRITVSEVLDRYLAGPVSAMRSGKDIRTRLEKARNRFGPLFLANVRGVDVTAWRDNLIDEGLAAQSVIHHLNAFSAMFTYAEKDLSIDLPSGNPVAKVRKPQAPKARDRRLRNGEFDALLHSAGQARSVGLRDVIVLAVETSMRLGELLNLDWSKIDMVKQTAHLSDTKNGDSRTVALSSVAIDALRRVPRRLDGKVFGWKAKDSFEKTWQRCIERARQEHLHAMLRPQLESEGLDADAELKALTTKGGKPSRRTAHLLAALEKRDMFLLDLRFHDLRHEATSRLFEKGLGIMEVASMTGHKSLSMLKRYTHVEAERLAAKLG
jgi:integrase